MRRRQEGESRPMEQLEGRIVKATGGFYYVQTDQERLECRARGLFRKEGTTPYVGDLVQKKSYTPDYLTHKKQTNRGEEPQIVLRDHHEPVIDRPLRL